MEHLNSLSLILLYSALNNRLTFSIGSFAAWLDVSPRIAQIGDTDLIIREIRCTKKCKQLVKKH